MNAITTMRRPATFGGRTRLYRAATPTGVRTGLDGTTVSLAGTMPPMTAAASLTGTGVPAAAHVPAVRQFTDQIAAAVANGVDAGLRIRRRPPA